MANEFNAGTPAAGNPAPAATPAAPSNAAPVAPVAAPVAPVVGNAGGAVADPNASAAAQQNPNPVQPGEEEMVLVNVLPSPDGTPSRAAAYVPRSEADRLIAEASEANAARLRTMPGAGQDANDHV